MLVAISTKQVNGDTLSPLEDGSGYEVLAPLFGIKATELGDRAERLAARDSGTVEALIASKPTHTHISVPVGATVTPREPVRYGDTVYTAVWAGTMFVHVEDKALTVYESKAARTAAEKAGRGR